METLVKVLCPTPGYLMGRQDNLVKADTNFIAKIMKDENTINHVQSLISLNDEDKKSVFDMIDFLKNKSEG